MPEPAPGRLRRLLERPDARRKVVRAVVSLLGVGIATIGVIGALMIWHLVRRGRLIREGLNPPRVVHLPEARADRARNRRTEAMTDMIRAKFRPHEKIAHPLDFRRAFERRRSASDGSMVVYGVENGRDHPRLGISIGRKKVRSAVERNRVKRVLREAFRLSKAELPAGLDLVVVPRGPGLSFADARRALPSLAQAIARRIGPPKVEGNAVRTVPWSWPADALAGLLILAIRAYQVTLSPLIGPVCRFEPSCSRYMIGAIRKYGVLKGVWKGTGRVLRCHPWHPGGYDPP